MSANEFREAFDLDIGSTKDSYMQYKIKVLSWGIEEILRRLDEQEEFRHDFVEWNGEQRVCACGRIWPHA